MENASSMTSSKRVKRCSCGDPDSYSDNTCEKCVRVEKHELLDEIEKYCYELIADIRTAAHPYEYFLDEQRSIAACAVEKVICRVMSMRDQVK